jgi:AcrR family transcriptional regulator
VASQSSRRPGQLPPGRHGLPRAVIAQSQRQRILDGVIDAVAELGYQETRLADVIARAGVSRKTFYEYFKDMEDCFLAAYDMHVAALTQQTSEAFVGPGARPWPEQVRDGVTAFLAYLTDHPSAARVCMVDAMGAGQNARLKRDNALRGFTFFVDAGRGVTSHDVPGRTAVGVLGGVNELIAMELLYGLAENLPGLAPDIVYMITLPFLGPRKALAEREKAAAGLAAD